MTESQEPIRLLPDLEEKTLEFWRDKKVFERSITNRQAQNAKPFVFYEGPPTANGKPGIHHVLARTFKDTITRFQTMKGRLVLRKAGWDTHGLPVELQVEKALGLKNKHDIETYGVAEFNKKCLESVWQYKDDWQKLTERMGYWTDLEHAYATYEPNYIESVWWAFQQIWDKEYVYQSHRVAPYCYRCGTGLSLAEVAQGYKVVTETSVYVGFRLNGFIAGDSDKPVDLVAWTTTPWTLPGNVALAVGKGIEYVAVDDPSRETILVVAAARQSELAKLGLFSAEANVIKRMLGSELTSNSYQPLFPGAVKDNPASFKVYDAPFVTTEDGTGVVHTAVMYGEDDYTFGLSLGLPTEHTVTEDGRFVDSVGVDLAGKLVKDPETETLILDKLATNNQLLLKRPYKHDYPFCWRCDTPLLYYARDAWFIRIDDTLRNRLVELNKTIKWNPTHVQVGRFGKWLEGLRDWSVSRDRYWGLPMPIWQSIDNPSEYLCIGSFAELEELAAPESKAQLQAIKQDPHKPNIDKIELIHPESGRTMRRIPQVLDVWFDAGSMPFAQWHYPFENQETFATQFPADFISEGIDQTRGWFNSMLIVNALLFDQAAYKSVITPNLVMDEKGQKMSKSRGNVIDPMMIMDKFGADAARFYFLSVNQPGDNKNFSEKAVLDVYKKTLMIWWNVVNFYTSYASFDTAEPGEKTVLDYWILALLAKTTQKIDASLSDLDTFTAARSFAEFIDELSTWYLRRNRKRQDQAFYDTLKTVLLKTAQLAAPMMPFLAEETYRQVNTNREESVHLTDFPAVEELDESLLQSMTGLRQLIKLGHNARVEGKRKVRQPLGKALLIGKTNLFDGATEIILEELNVKAVEIAESVPEGWLTATDGALTIALDPVITPELAQEGLVRELVRACQDLRKQAGYQPGQPVNFRYATDDQELRSAITNNTQTLLAEISGAVIVEATTPGASQWSLRTEQTIEINGSPLTLGLADAR